MYAKDEEECLDILNQSLDPVKITRAYLRLREMKEVRQFHCPRKFADGRVQTRLHDYYYDIPEWLHLIGREGRRKER